MGHAGRWFTCATCWTPPRASRSNAVRLYHGMHGLVRYRQRRFGKLDVAQWAREELAAGKPATGDADPPPAPSSDVRSTCAAAKPPASAAE